MKTAPAWSEEDLGMPLPETQHACSVCLPTWESVIGYEEQREKIMVKLRSGYPRFMLNPLTSRLFNEATTALADNGSKAIVFPNRESAQRAQRYAEKRSDLASRVVSYEGLQALIVTEADFPIAMEYWRYTGEIVTSRQAEAILRGKQSIDGFDAQNLRQRIADFGNYSVGDVFLYESGMAGLFAAYRLVNQLSPGKKTLQLEFPYVDAMRVQKHFGNGVVFLNEAVGESFELALQRIGKGEFSAVFCETPSNPLLRMVDLESVASACRDGGVPLIVDDTTCSVVNIDVSKHADVVLSSLTKWISGKGDVMAGQVTICKKSPCYSDLMEFFDEDCPNGIRTSAADAYVLSQNIDGFQSRMEASNANGEAVADLLIGHPAVERVWYPKITTPEQYDSLKRKGGGYGGLVSFVLSNRKKSAKFFDALKISKGPSLGTEFSLACPYTLLAHYDELAWAEGCGLDKHLIRVSLGAENKNRLLDTFGEALDDV